MGVSVITCGDNPRPQTAACGMQTSGTWEITTVLGRGRMSVGAFSSLCSQQHWTATFGKVRRSPCQTLRKDLGYCVGHGVETGPMASRV